MVSTRSWQWGWSPRTEGREELEWSGYERRLRVPARRLGGDVPLTELGHGESRLVDKGKAGKERQRPAGTPYWRAGNRRHTHQDNQGDGSEGTDARAMGRTYGATRDGEAARE